LKQPFPFPAPSAFVTVSTTSAAMPLKDILVVGAVSGVTTLNVVSARLRCKNSYTSS
jgi:hypothetical protein